MKDTDLYSRIPGLAVPWIVESVELDTVEGRVDIRGCFYLSKSKGQNIGMRAKRLSRAGLVLVDVKICGATKVAEVAGDATG